MFESKLRPALWLAVLAASACEGRAAEDDPGALQAVTPPSVDPPLCSFEATYRLTEKPLWGYDGSLGMHLSVAQAGSQAVVSYTFVPSPDDVLGQLATGEWTTHVTQADQRGRTLPGATDIALLDPFVGDPSSARQTDYPAAVLGAIYRDNYEDLEAAIPDDDDPESEEAVLPTTRPWARMTPRAPEVRAGCTIARYDRRVDEALVTAREDGSIGMQVPPGSQPSYGSVDWILLPRGDGSVCKAFGGHANDAASASLDLLFVDGQPVNGCAPPPPPPTLDAGPPPTQDAGLPTPTDAGLPPSQDAGLPHDRDGGPRTPPTRDAGIGAFR